MRRFDIERAVLRAQLPGPSVAIMLGLCTRINARTGYIPPDAQPSLSRQAAQTGYHRSTVIRHLAALETAGWIERRRPPVELARRYHLTTFYAPQIPASYPQARRRGEPPLGAERDEARRALEQELGAREAMASRAERHKTEEQTETTEVIDRTAAAADDDLATAAKAELEALTGRPVGKATAAAAVRLVLEGRQVRDRRAYLIAALREDPRRYLPSTTGPRQFRDGKFTD